MKVKGRPSYYKCIKYHGSIDIEKLYNIYKWPTAYHQNIMWLLTHSIPYEEGCSRDGFIISAVKRMGWKDRKKFELTYCKKYWRIG